MSRTSNALTALTNLAPLFLGSGTKSGSGTTTTTPNANPDAIAALTQLLHSQAADPNAAASVTHDATQNAIKLMLQAGIPQIGSAERSSGIFNSSQTAQATSQLEGNAAAAGAKLQLDQMNQSASLQGQTADQLNKATASTTVNTNEKGSTGPAVNPMLTALALGTGVLFANKDAIFGGGGGDSTKKGSNLTDLSFGNASPTLDTPITSATSSLLDGLGSIGTSIAGGLKNATFDPVSGTQNTGGIGDLANVAGNVAASTGISALFSGLTSGFSGLFGGGGGSSGDSGSSGGTVICTRMHELGYLSNELYEDDCIYGQHIAATDPALLAWYHSWAVSLVANWMHGNTFSSCTFIHMLRVPVLIWSVWMQCMVERLELKTILSKGE